MPPSLTDDQIAQIETAAAPLPALFRDEFVQCVTRSLRDCGEMIGPGTIFRTCREWQSAFLDIDHAKGKRVGKYARG